MAGVSGVFEFDLQIKLLLSPQMNIEDIRQYENKNQSHAGSFLLVCCCTEKLILQRKNGKRLLCFCPGGQFRVLWCVQILLQKLQFCSRNTKHGEFWPLKTLNMCVKDWLPVASVNISVGRSRECVFVLCCVSRAALKTISLPQLSCPPASLWTM